MAGRKSDFTLTKLDDLFSTQEQRDEEKLSKIRDIPLTEIDDFPDHPFKVRDDEDMVQLVESKWTAFFILCLVYAIISHRYCTLNGNILTDERKPIVGGLANRLQKTAFDNGCC